MENTKVSPFLSQQGIRDIAALRDGIKLLAETMKREEALLASLEDMAVAALKTGTVEAGPLSISLDEVTGRSSPKWKEEYVDHMVTEHAASREAIEKEMKVKYPGKVSEKLVLSETATVQVVI